MKLKREQPNRGRLTFGRACALVSMVAGAMSVSSIKRFSMFLVLVGVELFRFFRAGDGVPTKPEKEEKTVPHQLLPRHDPFT